MPDLNPNTLRLFDEFVLGIKQEPAPGAPEGVAKKAQEGSGTAKRNAEMSDKTRPSRIASGLTEHFTGKADEPGMGGRIAESIDVPDVPGESPNAYPNLGESYRAPPRPIPPGWIATSEVSGLNRWLYNLLRRNQPDAARVTGAVKRAIRPPTRTSPSPRRPKE